MKTWALRLFVEFAWAVIILSAILVANSPAQDRQQSSAKLQQSLKAFLQMYVSSSLPLGGDRSTHYAAAFSQLTTGPSDAIVYLSGNEWCGSGGCTTLVLAPDGQSWRVITKITITRPPIRVLNETTNGWHSIAVWVGGGGIQPGYEADLPFDGKSYPTNPSVPPARPMAGRVAGGVAISSGEGLPLFP